MASGSKNRLRNHCCTVIGWMPLRLPLEACAVLGVEPSSSPIPHVTGLSHSEGPVPSVHSMQHSPLLEFNRPRLTDSRGSPHYPLHSTSCPGAPWRSRLFCLLYLTTVTCKITSAQSALQLQTRALCQRSGPEPCSVQLSLDPPPPPDLQPPGAAHARPCTRGSSAAELWSDPAFGEAPMSRLPQSSQTI